MHTLAFGSKIELLETGYIANDTTACGRSVRSTQRLTLTVTFTFVVKPILPVEVLLCFKLPDTGRVSLIRHSILTISIAKARIT